MSKPTIYRRWRRKAELVSAVIAYNIDVEPGPPKKLSTKDALICICATFANGFWGSTAGLWWARCWRGGEAGAAQSHFPGRGLLLRL